MLLRKEVSSRTFRYGYLVYDFVPIADPTFDSSLLAVGHWLRVLPTFVT